MFKHEIMRITLILLVIILLSTLLFGTLYAEQTKGNPKKTINVQDKSDNLKQKTASPWIYISAALCIGFSSIAAGWALSNIGAAAMGTISEKPETAGKLLPFVGLAEGIAILGLVAAIMILSKA